MPSTTPWREHWRDLPTSSLGLRIVLRIPADPRSLVRIWMGFAAPNQLCVAADGPAPYATFVRVGSDLGRGEWVGKATDTNLERVVDSYASYGGGVCAWKMGDAQTDREGGLGLATSRLLSDDPERATGTARIFLIDREGAGVPRVIEAAWLEFFRRIGREFDVLYGEISPDLDDEKRLTGYEMRTGRRPTGRVINLEIEQRLRGCGWVTWVPARFAQVLDLDLLASTGAFHRIERFGDHGVLLQATETSREFTEARQVQVERLLHSVLEPGV